ncbi:hypothetical protein FRC01_005679 [Tulasnella sp. 417]|nr:hypothetical protein FRC01_005679 [Tulasnella sp. 417]
MLQADRTSHHTSAFAYPPYGQPGPSSQVKAPSSTSNMPTPSNGSVNGQQQQPPRMAQGRQQQQQHLAPTNHTPESGRTSRIANFVAHNTCAMICYIWFADPRPLTPASENPPATSSSSDPPASSSLNPYSPSFPAPQSNPTSARLQFCPTKQFTDFMHSLLTTTQVSQGVIVLSLCYIFRLKRQNPGIVAQPGSELRLAVVGLMLANKFLDDNTYTNLTWSQIAKIPLADINNMEREFLGGLGHQLFIDQKAYEGWLLMLNGLMWAKERAYDGWRRMMYGSAQASAMVSSTERGRNGIESHSNASSDDSRASSGIAEMPSSSMVTIGGYADGSGELRAALGRMSLEPAAVRGQDMVMVKQEEIDDVEEDEEDVDDVKEEDEDMMASHVRGESVVEHLIAPYHADEKLVSRGLPQYLTYHTLAASPSVMVDARQQAPQPVPAQSQAVVIPPPASSQEAHHAFGARDRGKTITRVQVNNFPVQYIQPPYMPVNSAANTTAFSIAPAGRTASFAHLGSRSARTSPTGLGFGSGVRGGFVGGMDVDSSYAPRHVSQPQRQVSMQRLQQQQQPSYPTAQQASSTVPSVSGAGHPRLPPLQTQHIIPPPATAAAATTTSSNNNHYHQPSHSHYASSPYANNHTNQAASYVNQPQGSFANAGPPGYQWPTNGSNGFFTGAAPNGSGHGNNNGYSAPTAAAVATPVHPFGDHHHYAPQSSQYGHQQDARWGYQQTQHLAQGQQAM